MINRQTRCILKDPYANAFYKDEKKVSDWKSDMTEMKPGVHERKWEIDSLCFPIRLAYRYWKTSGDAARSMPHGTRRFGSRSTLPPAATQDWPRAVSFPAADRTPTDTLPGSGYGRPVKPVGLICSMFRPSDDATVFPFLVPSNFFAVVSLRQAAEMLDAIRSDRETASACRALADEVERALALHAVVTHARFGKVLAYEVDGYGNSYCLDDSNVPSLLALPYFGAMEVSDPLYQNTRRMLMSDANPYYVRGRAARGTGRPACRPGHDLAPGRDPASQHQ